MTSIETLEGSDTPYAAYIPVNVLTKWTFESSPIRKWVEGHLTGRVLNACSGKTHLNHDGEVLRNDTNSEREAHTHTDVATLAAEYEPESFDCIVFDPPWTLYQSNLRYDGHHVHKDGVDIDLSRLPLTAPEGKEQLGHARLAKDGFNYLLKPGGVVIQITYHGTCMPARLHYEQLERVIFDPIGENKAVIGSADRKSNSSLEQYTKDG